MPSVLRWLVMALLVAMGAVGVFLLLVALPEL